MESAGSGKKFGGQDTANQAGVELEVRLVLLFLLYLCYLVWKSRSQKKRLLAEKQRLAWIVEGILPLFSRFVMVNYDQNSYEYLEGTQPGVPGRGCLGDLLTYMSAHYIGEPGREPPAQFFTAESVQRALRGDKPYLQYEYRIGWDGEHWENASVLCLRRRDGVPVCVLIAIQDVTALKKWERNNMQALQDAYRAAEEANHAKSDFLSRMSHDIRTPMNAIMGMTSIALMHLDDPERLGDCLDKIDAASRHLLSLINEVLDMSKIESGKLSLSEEPFRLPDVVEGIVTILQPQMEAKGQRLEVDLPRMEHEALVGDPLRLRQMLGNLLSNASKFTSDGGSITFRVRELPSRIQGSACCEFVVEDDGIGMEQEFLSQIFDPFTRSRCTQERRIAGTGLGMPIAKSIAQMMSGEIQVESKVGEGSRFTVRVYLKLQPEQAGTQAPQSPPAGPAPGLRRLAETDYRGLRVLLVEDNELNMEIARELFATAGIRSEAAWDGQEAVDAVQARPAGYYGLIFMDIQMPNKNGYEAAREIRALGRADLETIPIVAMSADAFVDDVRRALDAGMNDHVAKPVELPRLLDALEKWVGRRV